MKTKCKDCRYYKKNEKDQYGSCFRNPPQIMPRGKENRESRFPDVKEDWECGEGRPREDVIN